ncbi:MAG: zinc ABC transporter substrate-binding protein [Rhizomicrobium sp.]
MPWSRAIAATLDRADHANAVRYDANRDHEIAVIASQERNLQSNLAPLRGRSYLVFHDAYRYFERRFELSPVGAVTVAPERPVGARRIGALRSEILKGKVTCVFREPQFSPRLIDTLVRAAQPKPGVLDPLGANA